MTHVTAHMALVRASRILHTPSPRQVLADSKGVMRMSELRKQTHATDEAITKMLDRMENVGEIERFKVGNHVMVKATGELREKTKDRSDPRSDKQRRYYGPLTD